jgi:hypothetical protein
VRLLRHQKVRNPSHYRDGAIMLQPDAFTNLPSAVWVDETLLAARAQSRVVAIRFGRTADPLCHHADAALQAAREALALEAVLSVYAVDLDEVAEFTYMYELYDPFTVMLFHRSKPLVFDAGHGPVRKLTEIASGAPALARPRPPGAPPGAPRA